MLTYLGSGARDYARAPIHVHRRPWWEFQAVVAGELAPLLPGDGHPRFAARRLWVFPPAQAHGWTGRPGAPCEVVVLHFRTAPEPLRSHAERAGWHACPLGAAGAERLRALAARLRDEHAARSDQSGLVDQLALCEASLLALGNVAPRRLAEGAAAARQVCDIALAWYAENLQRGPTLAEVAAAAHCSVSHLRRVFHRVQGRSPLAACSELRFRRARELMEDPRLRLADIAEACGFAEPSAFSRAFRAAHGRSPQAWRAAEA